MKTAKEELILFVKEKEPDCMGLILGGSSARKGFSKDRDVDLFCITRKKRETLHCNFHGYEVDISFLTPEWTKRHLEHWSHAFIDLLLNSKVLYDPMGLIREQKSKAREIRHPKRDLVRRLESKGPSANTSLREARQKLNEGDKFQSLMLLRDAVKFVGDVAIMRKGSFKTYRLKYFIPELKRLNAELYKLFKKTHTISSSNKKEIMNLIKEVEKYRKKMLRKLEDY